MSINLAPPATDNVTDDILVLSANGDVNKTSKAAIVAEAGGNQNLQQVTDIGNLTTHPIVVYSVADASVKIDDDNIQFTRRVSGVDKVTTVDFEAATTNHTLTIPAKNAPDTFAMLSDISGIVTPTLQQVIEEDGVTSLMDVPVAVQTTENVTIYSGAVLQIGSDATDSVMITGPSPALYQNDITSNISLDNHIPNKKYVDDAVAAVGAVDLQEVTDNGSTTTNTITVGDSSTFSKVFASFLQLRNTPSNRDFTLAPTGASFTYLDTGFVITFAPNVLTANRTVLLPDASGTIALTSDITAGIPLTGTTAGNPVTGDVDFNDVNDDNTLKLTPGDGDENASVSFFSNANVSDPTDYTRLSLNLIQGSKNGNYFQLSLSGDKGITALNDYTANIGDLDYTQKKYVDDAIAAIPSGATNLSYTASPTNGTVNSDTGTDATLTLATGTNAGLLSPTDFTKLSNVPSNTNTSLAGKQDAFGANTGYVRQSGGSTTYVNGTNTQVPMAGGALLSRNSLVLEQVLSGYVAGTNTVLTSSMMVLEALQNLQAQISSGNSYVAKTANYTLTDTDRTVDLTANSATLTLPTAVGRTGKMYTVKNTGSGTTLTLATTSSQTIDGTTTKTFNTQYSGCTVQSTGSNWIIIATF